MFDRCFFCDEEFVWYPDECPQRYSPGCGEQAMICGAHALLLEDAHWQALIEQWDKRDWDAVPLAEKIRRMGWPWLRNGDA